VTDIFNEVDEQLRSQRYQDMFRRSWPFAVAAAIAALLIALGVWAWNRHETDAAAKASLVYQAGLDAAQKGDLNAADKDFGEAVASSAAGYRTLALMQQAQIRLDQGRTDDAVRLFDQAAKISPDVELADVAKLKAAYLLMDSHPLPEIEARLTPLTAVNSPYRTLAMEALAMARLQAGKLDQAKGDFAVLALSQDVSPTAQARAHAAADLIQSGSASVIPAAVKSAAAVPPQVAAMLAAAAQNAAAQNAAAQNAAAQNAAGAPPSAPQAGAAQ
jgi:hypothetical protein